MSKVSIQGDISGTGDFTIKAPNSNVDRTLDLPDEAGTLATVENLPAGYTDSDALDLFNATGSAPVYACRAWVNFDGSGTAPIRDSRNVSSITNNGTGDYTVNFATAMPDNNYCALVTPGDVDTAFANAITASVGEPGLSSGSFRIVVQESDPANALNRDHVFAAVFR